MVADPTPITVTQLGSLLAVAVRELTWVIPGVSTELRLWRQVARAIPDGPLREDALATLRRDRMNSEGAALFATLPPRRDRNLLRATVAYQLALDYLDTISERPADDPLANGRQLQRALADALTPEGPVVDYYRHHLWRDDGGFLGALVAACRESCARLPSFHRVQALVALAGRRLGVQGINHDPDPVRRDRELIAFAQREFPGETRMGEFELTAAASSSLAIFAMLALAADPATRDEDIRAAHAAYTFWICAASTLLDSFVDQAADAANGDHSYVAHYPSAEVAARRIAEIVNESARSARELRRGTRHALIASGVVAMYLSKTDARDPTLAETSRRILRAAGSLPRIQLPIMRAMRAVHGLRSA